jgi:hypothetical protein
MVLPVLSLAVARVLYDFLCTGPHTSDLHSGKQPYSSQSITERSIKRERDATLQRCDHRQWAEREPARATVVIRPIETAHVRA